MPYRREQLVSSFSVSGAGEPLEAKSEPVTRVITSDLAVETSERCHGRCPPRKAASRMQAPTRYALALHLESCRAGRRRDSTAPFSRSWLSCTITEIVEFTPRVLEWSEPTCF